MKGFWALLLRELLILKHRWPRFATSWTVTPALYMIAFGWGLGRQVTVEGMPYIAFLLPGLIAMSTMTQSFALATELNVARFYWRIFEHFQAAPVSFCTITAAETCSAIVRGVCSALIILLLGLAFGVHVHLCPELILGILLNSAIFGSLGVAAAMVVRGHADQVIIANFVITPMSFLCGTVFSLRVMPGWANAFVHALPLTYSTRVIRAAAHGRTAATTDLLVLILFAALCFMLAYWTVRKSRI